MIAHFFCNLVNFAKVNTQIGSNQIKTHNWTPSYDAADQNRCANIISRNPTCHDDEDDDADDGGEDDDDCNKEVNWVSKYRTMQRWACLSTPWSLEHCQMPNTPQHIGIWKGRNTTIGTYPTDDKWQFDDFNCTHRLRNLLESVQKACLNICLFSKTRMRKRLKRQMNRYNSFLL